MSLCALIVQESMALYLTLLMTIFSKLWEFSFNIRLDEKQSNFLASYFLDFSFITSRSQRYIQSFSGFPSQRALILRIGIRELSFLLFSNEHFTILLQHSMKFMFSWKSVLQEFCSSAGKCIIYWPPGGWWMHEHLRTKCFAKKRYISSYFHNPEHSLPVSVTL